MCPLSFICLLGHIFGFGGCYGIQITMRIHLWGIYHCSLSCGPASSSSARNTQKSPFTDIKTSYPSLKPQTGPKLHIKVYSLR